MAKNMIWEYVLAVIVIIYICFSIYFIYSLLQNKKKVKKRAEKAEKKAEEVERREKNTIQVKTAIEELDKVMLGKSVFCNSNVLWKWENQRSDLYIVLAFCIWEIKLLYGNVDLTQARNLALNRALSLNRARDVNRVLSKVLTRDLTQDLTPDLTQDLTRDLTRARDLARDLDLNQAGGSNQARDLALDLAWNLDLDLARDLARDLALAKDLALLNFLKKYLNKEKIVVPDLNKDKQKINLLIQKMNESSKDDKIKEMHKSVGQIIIKLMDQIVIINPTKQIGAGAQGRIFKTDFKGTSCALKIFTPSGYTFTRENTIIDQLHSRFLSEKLVEKLDHPNIVKFYHYFEKTYVQAENRRREKLNLIKLPAYTMELYEESLLDFSARKKRNAKKSFLENKDTQELLKYLIDASEGISFLHKQGVIHRDIKPSNILVKEGKAALTDLGVTCWQDFISSQKDTLSPGALAMEVSSTPKYMAPEAKVECAKYKPPSDIYSFGITMLKLFFFEVDPRVISRLREYKTPLEKKLLNFLELMCKYEPEQRPNIRETKKFLIEFKEELVSEYESRQKLDTKETKFLGEFKEILDNQGLLSRRDIDVAEKKLVIQLAKFKKKWLAIVASILTPFLVCGGYWVKAVMDENTRIEQELVTEREKLAAEKKKKERTERELTAKKEKLATEKKEKEKTKQKLATEKNKQKRIERYYKILGDKKRKIEERTKAFKILVSRGDKKFHQVDLSNAKLEKVKLENIELNKANLQKSYLQRAYLQGAHLQNANLQDAKLQYANLLGAYLQDANFQDAKLQYANLQGADLLGANLLGAYLLGAELLGAYLEDANLQGAYLQYANLQYTYLQGTNLQGSYLLGANLQGAKSLTPEQISKCRSIKNIRYLPREFLLQVKKLNPALMKWWNENMVKEIDKEYISDENKEGWTGNWIKPNNEESK